MADYHLAVYESNALHEIVSVRKTLLDGAITADGLIAYAVACRVLAACAMLARLDAEEARAWLARSGQAHLAAVAKQPSICPATGRASALRDVLVAGDRGLARAVAATLSKQWSSDEEYEDEFLFQRFLIEFGLDEDPRASARTLEALRTADGVEDGRLGVCEALLAGDQSAFMQALSDCLESHHLRYLGLREREGAPPEELDTSGKIAFDVLAVARLGEWAGMSLGKEQRFLPLAMITGSVELPKESWRLEPPTQ